MRYKCIHCGHYGDRVLIEDYFNGKLHCSPAKCRYCGAKMIISCDKSDKYGFTNKRR